MSHKQVAASIKTIPRILILAVTLFIMVGLSCAQSPSKTSAPNGLRHYDIKVSDLPAPEVQNGPRNQSRVIPKPDGAELTRPPGFQVKVFAEGDFKQPRQMALAPNGDVFVAESQGNRVSILRDSNGD